MKTKTKIKYGAPKENKVGKHFFNFSGCNIRTEEKENSNLGIFRIGKVGRRINFTAIAGM